MSHQRYPSDLTDSQWHLIKDFLPPPARTGRPPLNLCQVLDAIYYVVRGGIQWRMPPRQFPKWQSVYHYFRRWRRIHDATRGGSPQAPDGRLPRQPERQDDRGGRARDARL